MPGLNGREAELLVRVVARNRAVTKHLDPLVWRQLIRFTASFPLPTLLCKPPPGPVIHILFLGTALRILDLCWLLPQSKARGYMPKVPATRTQPSASQTARAKPHRVCAQLNRVAAALLSCLPFTPSRRQPAGQGRESGGKDSQHLGVKDALEGLAIGGVGPDKRHVAVPSVVRRLGRGGHNVLEPPLVNDIHGG